MRPVTLYILVLLLLATLVGVGMVVLSATGDHLLAAQVFEKGGALIALWFMFGWLVVGLLTDG